MPRVIQTKPFIGSSHTTNSSLHDPHNNQYQKNIGGGSFNTQPSAIVTANSADRTDSGPIKDNQLWV